MEPDTILRKLELINAKLTYIKRTFDRIGAFSEPQHPEDRRLFKEMLQEGCDKAGEIRAIIGEVKNDNNK